MNADESPPPETTPPDAEPSRVAAARRKPPAPRGYRAGARVSNAGAERAVALATVTAVVLALAFGVALFDPEIPLPSFPAEDRSVEATIVPASPLPSLEIALGAPQRPLPMLAGGLRWLDPLSGRLSGTPYEAFEGAPFVNADGTVLCVCVERPWQQHGGTARVTLVRTNGPAGPADRVEIVSLETDVDDRFGNAISIEPALSPDRSTVYLATIVRQTEGLVTNLLAVNAASGRIASSVKVPLPRGEGGPAYASLRIDPNGRSMRLTVWSTPLLLDPENQWAAHAFEIHDTKGELGVPRVVPPIDTAVGGPGCFGEAYMGPSLYGALCGRPADRPDSLALETLDASGERRSVLLPAGLTPSPDTAIDAAAGRVFIWSPENRVIVRVNARTGDIDRRSFDSIAASAAGAPEPGPSSRIVHWSRLIGAQDVYSGSSIVGSQDGTLLYAIGSSPQGSSSLDPSTGVLVIDAATLDLVAAWAPVAYYRQIATTPDRAFVIGLGLGGVDATGAPAQWPDSITFHRIRGGDVAEVIGSIDGLSGWTPVLLAGPA